jgi:diacylglycerol kinase
MRQFFKSVGHALNGLRFTFQTERNFRIHVTFMILSVLVGIYLGLSVLAWGLLIFAIGIVLVAELFNTALERLSDEIANGKRTSLIRHSKDISAAAVMISALFALLVGILILIIPLIKKIIGILTGS